MPSGSGELPSWRCFGGLGAFLRAPAPDDDDDVAIAAARRRPRGTVVVGSGRTNLPRRRADDSSLPLLGSRLEGADEARRGGAEADAVAVGRTLPRSHLTVNASQGSVRPWPSLPRFFFLSSNYNYNVRIQAHTIAHAHLTQTVYNTDLQLY